MQISLKKTLVATNNLSEVIQTPEFLSTVWENSLLLNSSLLLYLFDDAQMFQQTISLPVLDKVANYMTWFHKDNFWMDLNKISVCETASTTLYRKSATRSALWCIQSKHVSIKGRGFVTFFYQHLVWRDSDFKNFETLYFTIHCYNICLLKFQNSCNYHFYSYTLPQTISCKILLMASVYDPFSKWILHFWKPLCYDQLMFALDLMAYCSGYRQY